MGDMSVSVLAAEGGGTSNFLIPNGTFFVVLIIFLIVLGVIGTFVVPPIMRVLRERDVMVTRTVDDNRKSAEQFAAAEADYERAMAEARKQASAIRDQARAEGRRILEEMRARARQESEAALQQAAEQLKRQSDEIAAGLRAALDSLSAALASRVLGVPVGAESSAKSSGTAATTVSGR